MRYKYAMFILCAFLLGILFGTSGLGPVPSWYFIVLFFATLLTFRRKAFTIVTILILSFCFARLYRRAHFRFFTYEKITFEGKVLAPPDIRGTSQYLLVKSNDPIAKTIRQVPAKGTILVKADKFINISYGDTIKAQGSLKKPESFSGFNYPLFLERDGVFAILPNAKVEILSKGNPRTPIAVLSSTRKHLEDIVARYIPEPESSFLSGLLFGSKRSIPTDITDALRATGTSHLVAISGANITFITAMALNLLPLTNRWNQTATISLVAFGLVLLTGASSSVTRGAIIASATSFVKALGRRPWPLSTVLLAASSMLLLNPMLLRADPGFQLSFAAYIGLLCFTGLFTRLSGKLGIPTSLQGSFAETSSASLGTFPLTVASGSFAMRGLVVNPLVLWLIPPATALGFILLASSVIPPLATIIAIPTWWILHTALQIITVASRL